MSSSAASSSPHGWEPPLPEELQKMLPQYEIIGILGRGGMGAVYKARQAKLNRNVAIKLLPETLTQEENEHMKFAERFELEAQAMAKLDHPAITRRSSRYSTSVRPAKGNSTSSWSLSTEWTFRII